MTARTIIFIDFWNYELTSKSNSREEAFKTDWQKLPWILTDAAKPVVRRPTQYDGMRVYLSYGPNDDNLRQWAETKLTSFAGYEVISRTRLPKGQPRCPSCRDALRECPSCHEPWNAFEEKGVDIKLAVDMLDMACRDLYDLAILVTDDKDFIPAVQAVQARGQKVIHAGFKETELGSYCWGHLDLTKLVSDFKRRERRVSSRDQSAD